MEKQTIHCSVHNCDFCDVLEDCCCLKEIKVCNCDSDHERESTMCDSFREKK